ncbi:hypothetical protein CLD33_05940 [Pasteurella multocida]|nr:hypothetical protein CLD33_05940 [Pasteurella multocida]QGV27275.1 hypothetical protein EER76_06695 [Pasteurella multocida]
MRFCFSSFKDNFLNGKLAVFALLRCVTFLKIFLHSGKIEGALCLSVINKVRLVLKQFFCFPL